MTELHGLVEEESKERQSELDRLTTEILSLKQEQETLEAKESAQRKLAEESAGLREELETAQEQARQAKDQAEAALSSSATLNEELNETRTRLQAAESQLQAMSERREPSRIFAEPRGKIGSYPGGTGLAKTKQSVSKQRLGSFRSSKNAVRSRRWACRDCRGPEQRHRGARDGCLSFESSSQSGEKLFEILQ